ncbi:MAG: hypothetical protein E3J86_08875 [Candidatus Thorarchaeota archaeon]|nr:MAG: hypothetical protein E3J86_08875 [Candidatus Thorarchaeota archaeon]
MVLSATPILCDAEETPCIVLAKPGEWYQIELNGINIDSEMTIFLSFDHNRSVVDRLEVKDPFQTVNDLLTRSVYHISNGSTNLFSVRYVNLDSVLFGEERARLEMTSSDYHLYLVGIQVEEGKSEIVIPPSFQIILALCTLLPFFLLMPDAISNLQSQLDIEAASKGVYGRILALLLPILSIALTALLLGGLDVF